uniref:Uncharacterized protein n=1 Tax=Timema monikensis TaxID=170555 RepID=A0A7R9HRZ2_9NEOP|nr:unnamed protein product [Timema monikensis]
MSILQTSKRGSSREFLREGCDTGTDKAERLGMYAFWTSTRMSNTDNPLQVPTCQQYGLFLICQKQIILSRYQRVSNMDSSSYVPTCQQSGLFLISQTQIIVSRYPSRPRVRNQDDAQNIPLLYTPELVYHYWLGLPKNFSWSSGQELLHHITFLSKSIQYLYFTSRVNQPASTNLGSGNDPTLSSYNPISQRAYAGRTSRLHWSLYYGQVKSESFNN